MWAILKKWRIGIFAGIALIVFAYTADPVLEFILRTFRRTNQSTAHVRPHWQRYTNRECGYVVEFPSRSFENPYTLSNRQNVISYRQFASSLGSNQAFMVATLVTSFTNDFSDEQIKFLLAKATRGALDKNGKLISERDIALGTNLGREIEMVKGDGNFIKMRFYQVGHDVQELTVLVPNENRGSTNISHFLDSFRLITKQ